ncbi:MAG: hypothetical protein ACYCZB_18180 [Acidiphilium sp.]
MFKPLAEMSGVELRAALDAAIEAERAADFNDVHSAWETARESARSRQLSIVNEMERRHAHFARISGRPEAGNV